MVPSYIENYVKSLRAWLSFNGIELKPRIKIGNGNEVPTIAYERLPMKEEFKQIIIARCEAKIFTGMLLFNLKNHFKVCIKYW